MDTKKKTILVVDDEKDLRDALSTVLIDEGFEVLTAEDGREGVSSAFRHHPDLILLDVVMPNLGGLEALKELRADEWGKDVKVIVLTVLEDMENISEVVEHGGLDYLIKTDWKLEDIVKKIKDRLGE